MDPRERLQAKLMANRRRLNCASLIEGLPEPLRQVLNAASLADEPTATAINAYVEPTRDGFISDWGKVPGGYGWRVTELPGRYAYAELQSGAEVMDFVAQHNRMSAASDVCMRIEGNDVLPTFRLRYGDIAPYLGLLIEPMKFGEKRLHLGITLQSQTNSFVLVTTDLSAGITVDDVRAQLPHCYAHNFEVACWSNESPMS